MEKVAQNCKIKYNSLLNIYDDFVKQRGKMFEYHTVDVEEPMDLSEPFLPIWINSTK